ncbi:apolipoprotein N-acyltransferase [Roseovarius indicus]|uniref:Apolipoprotein N-acyltransferase n=1 Tax=Roseovarius indicus TaxID=540747 RepID=A0A0T5NZ49_9RHOB|nr:apolipoprotein N-acyltransferase [Roseovarius indicus]KRS14148.1 acyltransferase [Roseovarius indicus]QEW29936.1 Apolipoprotein N-acyltransferase [Roseovarius indicus]SFE81841.1 apolipoprotein N-acyltransferase [Roseovarius indicus]
MKPGLSQFVSEDPNLFQCMGLALAAGGLTVLTLPPFSWLIAVPVAFSVLFIVLRNISTSRAFLVGWAFGLGQFGIGISWIAESFYVDAERFGALAIPAVAGLSAGLAIFPGMAALLFAAIMQRRAFGGIAAGLLFASCWVATEWLRGHVLTGFPWNLAAYALVDYAALRQPAAWVGSYGLGFLTVFIGILPGVLTVAAPKRRAPVLVLFAVAVTGLWVGGALRSGQDVPPTDVALRIVQGNVPQVEKWALGSRERTLEKYLGLSAQPGRFDVLLWPETAFPGFLDEDAAARTRISAALPDDRVLLTGVPDRVEGDGGTRYFNTVKVYDGRGEVLTGYAKHHLVPFGEYVPLKGWLPIERLTVGLGDFTPGPGPRTLAVPGAPLVAAAICYEIIFPGHVVDDLFRPDWIFNATNDAWFGTSIGPEQHLASARMRAVEEGLPVVRAANTGISAIIDAKGEIIARLETGQTGVIDASLPTALAPTPYARFGDWTSLALICAVWALAFIVGLARRRFNSENSKSEES